MNPGTMRSAITVSLVPEARGGPFVFWDDLAAACASIGRLGFDAIEIFPPDESAIRPETVRPLLQRNGLRVAAVGTGAGWVRHRLTLTSFDPEIRAKARTFVRSIVDAAGQLGAPAIIGSMQGRWGEGVDRGAASGHLIDALEDLGERAGGYGVPLIYEPLNRYETNMANTLADGLSILARLKSTNVKLLADLFHMNIEESDLPASIRSAGAAIGHVHLADSNRRPAGNGHTDFAPIAAALRDVAYNGYISAECFSWPDPEKAAGQTINTYRRYFAGR